MKTAILDNIYRNGNLVTTMFRNGSLIYQRITKEPEPGPGPVVDYSTMYLTIEALETGTFYARNADVDYSVNGGTWQTTTGETALSLNQGDTVRFKGTAGGNSLFSGNTLAFNAYGNVESLEYGDDFINKDTIKIQNSFGYMFNSCTGLREVSNLILPATTLQEYCYYSMFSGCSNIEKAPELPAPTLAQYCYSQMFSFSSVNHIVCLAVNMASDATFSWCRSVSSSGTFVKKAGVTWPTGANGIPTGWTVIEE